MKQFVLRKGLNLPISGNPRPDVVEASTVTSVALLGADYIGLKPKMAVAEGDEVVAGSPVLINKSMPEAQIVSPVSGRVRAITRGARRKLISVVIDTHESSAAPVDFSKVGDANTRAGIAERLCAAGLWTSFRTRPYSKVPAPDSTPIAIYVTAMDTEPLAPGPADRNLR